MQFDQINAHQTRQLRLMMLYFSALMLAAGVLVVGLAVSV